MKVAIIGATGYLGKYIVEEALRRGHEVTAISRSGSPLPQNPRLHPRAIGQTTMESLTTALEGHDAVISATPFVSSDQDVLLNAFRQAFVLRLIIVGGAGGLLLPDGRRNLDQPEFPAEYRQEALTAFSWYENLRAVSDIRWTFACPSADIFPGPSTGTFRLGKDHLLFDARGKSAISAGDFAVALIDEMENPKHDYARFTVGY